MESGDTLHATKLPEEMPVLDNKFQESILQYDHEKTFKYMSAEMLQTYRERWKEEVTVRVPSKGDDPADRMGTLK